MLRTGASHSPIGLDLSGRQMRAVQLVGRPGAWRVAASVRLARTDPDDRLSARDLARLRDVLDRRAFRGRRVILGLDGSDLTIESLELPPRASGAPIEALARVEIARSMHCDAEAIECAAWDLPPEAGARRSSPVMGVACRHEAADEVAETVEGAGFLIEAMDVRALAGTRAAQATLGRLEGMAVLVDLDWRRAQLVVTLDGSVVQIRRIDEGGMCKLCEAARLALRVGIDEAELLLQESATAQSPPPGIAGVIESHWDRVGEEVRLSIAYLEHRHPGSEIRTVAILGEGAIGGSAADAIERATGIAPVRIGAGEEGTEADCARCPGLVVASGLAMWGTEEGLPRVNLLPARRRRRAVTGKRIRGWTVAAAAYSALGGGIVAAALLGREDLDATRRSIETASGEAERIRDEIDELGARVREQAALLAAHHALQADPDWSMLLALVASRVGEEIQVLGVRLDPMRPPDHGAGRDGEPEEGGADGERSAHQLVLSGFAPNQVRVTGFVLALEGLSVFDEVKILEAHRSSASEGEGVRFVVVCEMLNREQEAEDAA